MKKYTTEPMISSEDHLKTHDVEKYTTESMVPFEGHTETYDVCLFTSGIPSALVLEILQLPPGPDAKLVAFVGRENVEKLRDKLTEWLASET